MAENARKTELTARIATFRAQLSQDLQHVRRDLDVPAQVRSSYLHHKSAWLGGAAVLGWVISRLPARRKKVKVYVDSKDERKLKVASQAGMMFGLGRLLFSALQPAVSAFAAKKVTDYLSRGGGAGSRGNKSAQR